MYPLTIISIIEPPMEICEVTVGQLVDMGFPREACTKAVFHTKNQGVEVAMNWIMEHIDDPGRL